MMASRTTTGFYKGYLRVPTDQGATYERMDNISLLCDNFTILFLLNWHKFFIFIVNVKNWGSIESCINVHPAWHGGHQIYFIFFSQQLLMSSLGCNHLSPSQQWAPETKCAEGEDVVMTGGEDTQIKTNTISLIHVNTAVVNSKSHILVLWQMILNKVF